MFNFLRNKEREEVCTRIPLTEDERARTVPKHHPILETLADGDPLTRKDALKTITTNENDVLKELLKNNGNFSCLVASYPGGLLRPERGYRVEYPKNLMFPQESRDAVLNLILNNNELLDLGLSQIDHLLALTNHDNFYSTGEKIFQVITNNSEKLKLVNSDSRAENVHGYINPYKKISQAETFDYLRMHLKDEQKVELDKLLVANFPREELKKSSHFSYDFFQKLSTNSPHTANPPTLR